MINITEHHTGEMQVRQAATSMITISRVEQLLLLESLARIHGFTLIDREERKGLQELVTEVDKDNNDYDVASTAWMAWQDRCEALASAVSSALRLENDQEV